MGPATQSIELPLELKSDPDVERRIHVTQWNSRPRTASRVIPHEDRRRGSRCRGECGPSAGVVILQRRLSPDGGQILAEKIKILAGQINDGAC
jgi:hypothetical protein